MCEPYEEFTIWIRYFKFTSWYACYSNDIVLMAKVNEMVHLESCAWMHEARFISGITKYMHEEWSFVGILTRW